MVEGIRGCSSRGLGPELDSAGRALSRSGRVAKVGWIGRRVAMASELVLVAPRKHPKL